MKAAWDRLQVLADLLNLELFSSSHPQRELQNLVNYKPQGVRNGLKVKGWDSWSRDPGSITSAGSHLRIGCGVPFILARSLRNGTKIPEVHCVIAHPTCSLKIPLCLFAKSSWFRVTMGIGRGLCTMGASTCTLERIALSAYKLTNKHWLSYLPAYSAYKLQDFQWSF